MSAELIAILAVGLTIGGLLFSNNRELRREADLRGWAKSRQRSGPNPNFKARSVSLYRPSARRPRRSGRS